jgi:putative ABC transport system permease protein
MSSTSSLDWLLLDIRHAARALLHRRRFAAVAVLTLALGIGASTAIYSVVYGVLLRQLPYAEAERLALIQTRDRTTGQLLPSGFSGPDFEDWRQWAGSLGSLALCSRNIFALDADAGFETVQGAFVSREFFRVLGVQASLGRLLGDSGALEIVISDRLWRRRFNADPQIVGRHVQLNGAPYTIVGVAPPGVTFPAETRASVGAPPEPPELWAPFEGYPGATKRSYPVGQIVVRLPPGRTFGQFLSQVDIVGRTVGREHPAWSRNREAVALSLPAELSGALRPALWLMLGAVGCVLLVACLNVANLLLARQTSRAREIALRVSLGAPRYRLIAHALAEALLLALVGGGLGVALAAWVVAAVRWLEPAELPRLDAIRVDLPVLVFALGVAVMAAVVSAAAPVWRLLSAGNELAVGAETKAFGSGKRARRVRSALVIVELAVSLILLVGATILTRSFDRLVGTDIGIVSDHVVTVEVNVAMGRTVPAAGQIQLADELVAATRRLPGVRTAAVANGLPPNRTRMQTFFQMPDFRTGQVVEHQMGLLNPTPEYFAVLGIPVLRGRTFAPADGPDTAKVAILNASAARRLFGSLDVVGRSMPVGGRDKPVTVVGVVGNVKYSGLDEAAPETVYLPFAQQPFRNMMLVARTTGDPHQLAGALAAVVHSVDRQVTVGPALTLDEVVWEAVARPRFRTTLLLALAGLALILAVVGLYGVSAYTVAQRTVEIGVRMALGAGRWQIVTMILCEGLSLAGAGAALGLLGAFWFTRALSGFVYGVTTHDAGSFLLAAAALILVTAAASLLAARRAAQIDPLVALRTE